jgi:two-component system nitrogen regulation sensor histidine kinase NtrY
MVDEFSSFARMPKPVMEPRTFAKRFAKPPSWSKSAATISNSSAISTRKNSYATSTTGWSARRSAISSRTHRRPWRRGWPDDAQGRDKGHILVRAYRSDDGSIAIEVIDNGKGLPRHNRAKLLEPYMTTREKGTGLGLAIVKKIMEDHGGRLELHDAPARLTMMGVGRWCGSFFRRRWANDRRKVMSHPPKMEVGRSKRMRREQHEG